MRLGICTTDFATMGADALFRQIGEMGFESVQFSFASIVESGYEARGDWEIPPAIAPETVRLVRGCARRYGLEIVAVNGTYNMAHPDAEVRQEGARRFAVLAQAAAELGAGMVRCARVRATAIRCGKFRRRTTRPRRGMICWKAWRNCCPRQARWALRWA